MSSATEFVVVRTAATPAEAKVLQALLEADGIRAIVDGDSLADEIAISRRIMNLSGVQVRVASAQFDAARELLGATAVDEDELVAQALAGSPDAEQPPAPPAHGSSRGTVGRVALLLCCGAAVTFFSLWRGAVEHQGPRQYDQQDLPDGYRLTRRSTGTVAFEFQFDASHMHLVELRSYGPDGALLRRSRQPIDEDFYAEIEELHADGLRTIWRDTDGDRRYDQCIILDQAGNEVRHQHWAGADGWVDRR